MSQAKPPLPQPGDADLVSVVNNVFSAIQTASGAVGGDNLREEGLDEFSLMYQSVVQFYGTWNGPQVLSDNPFTAMVIAAQNVRTTGFTVGIDQMARVRAEFQCVNDPAGGQQGVPAGSVVQSRLRQRIAAVFTVITGTTRTNDEFETGVFTMDCILGPGVYDWIEVQSQAVPVAQYRVGYASIVVELFSRAT